MKNSNTPAGPALLALLTLFAPLGSAQDSPSSAIYSSETYGQASGDIPLPGHGLVLELVDGTLRLFGGVPGNAAAIEVSASKTTPAEQEGIYLVTDAGVLHFDFLPGNGAQIDTSEGWGQSSSKPDPQPVRLIGDSLSFCGTFDWRGYFEVPFDTHETTTFHAQGWHQGVFAQERSNGLTFSVRESGDDSSEYDAPDPSKPEEIEAAKFTSADDLAAVLRTALNSEGDSVELSLHIEASLGAGAAGAVATDLELAIQRADGFYELRVGRSAAMSVGLEAIDGIEANASLGGGGHRVFRFHSAPGVARGVQGLILALTFPNLQPGHELGDPEVLVEAQAAVDLLREELQNAQAVFEQAEALFESTLKQKLAQTKAKRDAALSARKQAESAYYGAKIKKPALYVTMLVRRAAYTLAQAAYQTATTAYNSGLVVADGARLVLENTRARFEEALELAARLGRIRLAIAQMRTYVTDHYAGFEVHVNGGVEAELKLPDDLLKVLGPFELGAEGSLEIRTAVFFEGSLSAPERITVTRSFKAAGEASLEVKVLGGTAAVELSIELVDAFEANEWLEWHRVEQSTSLSADTLASFQSKGTGSRRTAKLDRAGVQGLLALFADVCSGPFSAFPTAGEAIAAMGDTFSLRLEAFGNRSVESATQERSQRKFDVGGGVSVAGNGGSIEGKLEWSDCGPECVTTTSIEEAVKNLIDKLLKQGGGHAG